MKRIALFFVIFMCRQVLLHGMCENLTGSQLAIARRQTGYNAQLPRAISLHCECGYYLGYISIFHLMSACFDPTVTKACLNSKQFDCKEIILKVIANVPVGGGYRKNGIFMTPFQELVLKAAEYKDCPGYAVEKAALLSAYGADLHSVGYFVLSKVVERPMCDFIQTHMASVNQNHSDAAQTQAVLQALLNFVEKQEQRT